VIIAVIAISGALIGLIAHDLAVQSLREVAFAPLAGTCHSCGLRRGWHRARCGSGHPSTRGWVVAGVSAVFATLFVNAVGVGLAVVPYLFFLGLTLSLAVTDVDSMRIVDRINLRGSAAAIALLAVYAIATDRLDDLWVALTGGGIYFAGALVLFLIVRGNGFGAGDVKLAPVLGVFTSFLGWPVLGQGVFITAMIGGVLALVAIFFMSAKRDTELPYGPAMILGAWTAIALVGVGTSPIWS
jgi:leader peptidase (prepilin peptidase) / N-methyltransferase